MLVPAAVCRLPQHPVARVAAAVRVPCAWPGRGRRCALRSPSTEHTLPCPALLPLPIWHRRSQPTRGSSGCSSDQGTLLPLRVTSVGAASTVSRVEQAVALGSCCWDGRLQVALRVAGSSYEGRGSRCSLPALPVLAIREHTANMRGMNPREQPWEPALPVPSSSCSG